MNDRPPSNISVATPPSQFWPEALWERRASYVTVGPDALGRLVRRGVGRDDIVCHTLLTAGKCNTNWRVELSDGTSLVVRIYERDAAACRRDCRITELVAATVPVPQMLGVLDEAAEAGGRPVAIFEWVAGHKPWEIFEAGDAAACEQLARALGAALAPIGDCKSFSHHGLLDAELDYRRRFVSIQSSFLDLIGWSLSDGRAGERLGPQLAARLEDFARQRAPTLEVLEGDYRLVHGDYKLSNLLVRPRAGRWEVAAVLDWEFAFAGSPLSDIAILLRHEDVFPSGFAASFAAGFRDAGGQLPDNWRELTRLLDLMNLCGFLNASQHRERLFATARRLVEETIACD